MEATSTHGMRLRGAPRPSVVCTDHGAAVVREAFVREGERARLVLARARFR